MASGSASMAGSPSSARSSISIDSGRSLRRLPAERQQVADQPGTAASGTLDLRRQLAQPLLALGQAGVDQLHVAQDHRQQVVEVVGHAARQAAERLQLLDLPQPGLEGALLGDVVADRDQLAGGQPEVGPHLDARRAVLAPHPVLAKPAVGSSDGLAHPIPRLRLGIEERQGVFGALDLLVGPTKRLLALPVPEHTTATLVERVDHHRRVLEDGAQALGATDEIRHPRGEFGRRRAGFVRAHGKPPVLVADGSRVQHGAGI